MIYLVINISFLPDLIKPISIEIMFFSHTTTLMLLVTYLTYYIIMSYDIDLHDLNVTGHYFCHLLDRIFT